MLISTKQKRAGTPWVATSKTGYESGDFLNPSREGRGKADPGAGAKECAKRPALHPGNHQRQVFHAG